MRESRPDVPILQMSGHTFGFVADHGGIVPQSSFLEKPFRADQLRAAVDDLIQGSR
jgi:hypothetical protein